MSSRTVFSTIILVALILLPASNALCQQEAIESITAEELRTHLTFIASDEMMGRDTPSPHLKLAARYLATMVESYGWKPLMPDGSFLQTIPLEISLPSERDTRLRVGSEILQFPADFGGSFTSDVELEADLVFVGFGVDAPDAGWADYEGLDVGGKIAVMLGGTGFDRSLPEGHPLSTQETRNQLRRRSFSPRQMEAAAIITILSGDEEEALDEEGGFQVTRRTAWPGQSDRAGRRVSTFFSLQVRPGAGADILGVSREELNRMFQRIHEGERIAGRALTGKRAELTVKMKTEKDHTQNVVAYLEGSDPQLKNEYVLFGCHYDHVGFRGGEVYNGADDDGSGTVALLEIAQAMSITRPKRSVVLVWHTGEEKGLRGSNYFVDNSPIPLESISAQLQMDMLSRNDPDSIYIIGSHFLSSEMDQINREVAERLNIIKLDDEYNDPERRDNYFRQSDHYPYHTVGIPVTFYFCGVHDDLHRPTDDVEKCNFDKFERTVKLIYSVGLEVGNHPLLLKLDRNPEVTSRGKHNRGG